MSFFLLFESGGSPPPLLNPFNMKKTHTALLTALLSSVGYSQQAPTPPVETVSEVVVTAEAPAYLPPLVKSGSKLDIPPQDQVQTVNTVTSQEIKDRGITNINQAVEVIPGVRPISGVYSSTDVTSGIRSRGFENRFSFINGMRFQAFGFPIETQMVDTLEVLKGPAGVSFGQGDPGGTLNIITKRPELNPFTELGFTYGSHDFYRATLDWNETLLSETTPAPTAPVSGKSGKAVQPLAATERPVLQARLNAAYQNSGSYRDFVDSERILVAPSVTWNITPDTTLNVQFSYMRDDFLFDRGLPPYPITLTLPRSTFTGDPDQPRSLIETYMAFWELEHRFNDRWKIVQRAGYGTQDGTGYELSSFTPLNGNGNDGQFPRDAYSSTVDNTYWLIQHQLHGEFDTGSLKHKMVLGFEYSYTDFGYSFDQLAQVQPFNLRRPVYGGFDFNGPVGTRFPFENYGDKAWAAYWDHQVELTPELKLSLGSRFDWSNGFYNSPFDTATEDRKAFGWSPRAGVVWQPTTSLDLFGSYAQTFAPNLFADGSGTVFDPEEGEAYEVGFRKRILNDRLQVSGAAFHITKENILNPDPTDVTGLRQVLNGEERSRGFEFEVKGELAPGWTLAAGYTYLNAEVTESTTDPIGLPLIDAPEHSATFFTRYKFQEGWAEGFFIGYGFNYAGARRSSFANPTFNLPSHLVHSAFVGYERDGWRAQVTLDNLTSEDYYETHGNNIFPQDAFNVRASISYRF
jgi:iron complex outermembrane recepter protein